jgi:hypothetical protein
MAFTSKISNIINGAITNQITNSIGSMVGNFAASKSQTSKVAAKLLNKSPLEIENINPTSHMKENPYQYGSVYYPSETANLGEGHYVIFDVVMHNSSKFKATNFNGGRISTNTSNQVGENAPTGKANSVASIKRGGFGAASRVGGVKSGLNEKTPTHSYISDSMILYAPAPSMKFTYSANYENLDTGIAGILGQAIGNFKDSKGIVDSLKAAASGMPDAAAIIGRKALFGAASLIPGFENAESAFDKAKGQAMNPQMEVVFKSVPFRTFEFPFEFAPKNPSEKDSIHKIINMFKFHMLPEYQGTTKGFFNVPSEFQITYMYRADRNTYIPRVSRCVLTNMTVDYAPEGVISSFIPDSQGAAPTFATMNLSFTETEIMTKERIADGF